jgi:hypothetical protein
MIPHAYYSHMETVWAVIGIVLFAALFLSVYLTIRRKPNETNRLGYVPPASKTGARVPFAPESQEKE